MVDNVLSELEWPRTTLPLDALYRLINTKHPEYGANTVNSEILNLRLFPTKRYPGRTTFQLRMHGTGVVHNLSYRRLNLGLELESRLDIRVANTTAITNGLILREINSKYDLVLSLDDVVIPDNFTVAGENTIRYSLKANKNSYVWIGTIELYIEIYAAVPPVGPDEINAKLMYLNLWKFIQRATGEVAGSNNMPALITKDGLVKHHQNNGATKNGYMPPGAATVESLALMLRGVANAYQYDGDVDKLALIGTLMNAACKYHYFGNRPTNNAKVPWYFNRTINGGVPFAVHGPVVAGGSLDSNGVVGQAVSFVRGVAILDTDLALLYQVVSKDAQFIWPNVFSPLVAGTGDIIEVEYYVDGKGRRHYGVQKNAAFGQPLEENSGEAPGTVVLKAPLTGTYQACFSRHTSGINVAYGEAFETWPMWRQISVGERQMDTDALHWFADAFRTMVALRPDEPEWRYALARTLDTWQVACNNDSDNSYLFKAGGTSKFDSFALTHGRATGLDVATLTPWAVQAPHAYISGERGSDGYTSMRLPFMAGSAESTDKQLRTSAYFENDRVFMQYTPATQLYADVQATVPTPCTLSVLTSNGVSYEVALLAGGVKNPLLVPMAQLVRYQDMPGDAEGAQTGDWQELPSEEWEMPTYNVTSFPGYRAALIGDGMTRVNTQYTKPTLANKWHEAYGRAAGGYFNVANQLLGQRLLLEHGLQRSASRPAGFNFSVPGSRVGNWWQAALDPLATGVSEPGPMYNALRNLDSFDIAVMMGGIQDLVRNVHVEDILLTLKKAMTDLAQKGKWVFVMTVLPITREQIGGWYRPGGGGWLGVKPAVEDKGFSLGEQNLIRTRILAVNQGLRDWFAAVAPKNCFLVDTYNSIVGPNGVDPAGSLSSNVDPLAQATVGNYKPDQPGMAFTYNGIDLTPAGAAVVGKVLAIALAEAGVPVPTASAYPLKYSANLLANPEFSVTTDRPANPAGASNVLGRAIGLGPAKTDITHVAGLTVHNNVGLGYVHGTVPDHWFVYRASNSNGEAWSNFNDATWRDLSPTWPVLSEYLDDSTWVDGCLKSELIWLVNEQAWKLTFATPKTGNRNESFVVKAMVPRNQPGVWDRGGTPGSTANTEYSPGDILQGEALVEVSEAKNLYGWRFGLNLISVNSGGVVAEGIAPLGSKMAAYDNVQSFWPPAKLPEQLHPTSSPALVFRTPAVQAPVRDIDTDRYYAELTFEFATDASQSASSVTVVIRQPKVRKVIGGPV